MSTKTDHYNNEYVPYIVRWGKITNIGGAILSFLPALVVLFIFKIKAPIGPLVAATATQLSASFAYYFVDPIAYYPVLGLSGTYMAFLTGNISNLRLPCAVNALKAAGVEKGTKEASIISTIGIAASVIVNVLMLTIVVFIGASVMKSLPQVIKDSLAFLVPAIYGAVFVDLSFSDPKIGAIAITISIIMTILLKLGVLNFLPGYPSYVVALTAVFGSVFITKKLYEKDLL